jgi:hypothetical protein
LRAERRVMGKGVGGGRRGWKKGGWITERRGVSERGAEELQPYNGLFWGLFSQMDCGSLHIILLFVLPLGSNRSFYCYFYRRLEPAAAGARRTGRRPAGRREESPGIPASFTASLSEMNRAFSILFVDDARCCCWIDHAGHHVLGRPSWLCDSGVVIHGLEIWWSVHGREIARLGDEPANFPK